MTCEVFQSFKHKVQGQSGRKLQEAVYAEGTTLKNRVPRQKIESNIFKKKNLVESRHF